MLHTHRPSGVKYVPIHPQTFHPDMRTPVETSEPLPWNDVHHATCGDVFVQANKDMHDYSKAVYILNEEVLDRYCQEDEVALGLSTPLNDIRMECFPDHHLWRHDLFVPIVKVNPNLNLFDELGDGADLQRDMLELMRYDVISEVLAIFTHHRT